jgi:hypothetical protein
MNFKEKKKKLDNNTNYLNNEFFEKLFILEMEFNQTENPDLINRIINLYNKAIKFYKEKNDKRRLDYENRLGLFLTDENVKKLIKENKININDLDKKKDNNYPKKALFNQNKIEENKKLIEKLIGTQNHYNDLVKKEINKQEQNFKEKLMKYKKMKSLKTNKNSFIKSDNDNNSNNDFSMNIENTYKKHNYSQQLLDISDLKDNFSNKNSEEQKEIINSTLSDLNSDSFNSDNANLNGEEILKTNETNETGNILNTFFDLSDNNNLITSQIKNKQSFIFNLIDSYKDIGSKQQKGLLEIENLITNSFNQINDYYYLNWFSNFIDKIKKLMNDKFKHYKEITKIYSNQIKDLELEISGIKNNIKFNELELQIEYLKDEQQNELDNIEEQYNNKIHKELKEFKKLSLNDNLTVELNKEKLKLDIYNKICGIITSSKISN